MGIKGFATIVKKYCPDQKRSMNLSDFEGCTFAIDVSIYLHRYVKQPSTHETSWLSMFVVLFCKLRKYGIVPVAVFDGKNFPPEKIAEREARRAVGAIQLHRIKEAKRLIKKIQKEYLSKHLPLEEEFVDEIRSLTKVKPLQDAVNYNDPQGPIDALTDMINKLERQTQPITDEHTNKLKKVIESLGIPCIQADGEAEKDCSFLCKRGYVDAVLGEDTDVLAYGAPVFVTGLNINTGAVNVYHHKSLLKALNVNYFTFRDICIGSQCDYNARLKKKGARAGCGPLTIYKYLLEHKTLEALEDEIGDKFDFSVLNYRRCREIFTLATSLPYISKADLLLKKFDEQALKKLLAEMQITVKLSYILERFFPVVFEITKE